MKPFIIKLALTVACLSLWPSPVSGQIPCAYEITHIIEPPPCGIGSTNLSPTAISPNGQYVCGYYWTCLSFNDRSFVYDTATKEFTTIPNPPGISISTALDVNDAGCVAGAHGGVAGDFGYIYDLQTGEFTNIPPAIENGTCVITSINANGSVCGWRSIGEPLDNIYNAFIWSKDAGVTDLGVMNGPRSFALSINDSNVVVGYTGTGSGALNVRVFQYSGGELNVFGPVPGALTSSAGAVDNQGRIMMNGIVQLSPSVILNGFIVEDNVFTQQFPLSGFRTLQRRGMNNNQIVVGNSGNPSLGTAPTVWINTIPINFSLLTASIEGVEIGYGRDVSDAGVIVAGAAIWGSPIALVLSPIGRLFGDADCDADVDVDDLIKVINTWGECTGCEADFTVDGSVDLLDLLVVIDNWAF
jgi:uncharacterized membrane protein